MLAIPFRPLDGLQNRRPSGGWRRARGGPGGRQSPEGRRDGVRPLIRSVPFPCGGQHYLDTGEEWPDGAFESCKAADAILLGAVGLPEAVLPNGEIAGVRVVFGLRFGLDLYANVRPTKLYPTARHKLHDAF